MDWFSCGFLNAIADIGKALLKLINQVEIDMSECSNLTLWILRSRSSNRHSFKLIVQVFEIFSLNY